MVNPLEDWAYPEKVWSAKLTGYTLPYRGDWAIKLQLNKIKKGKK